MARKSSSTKTPKGEPCLRISLRVLSEDRIAFGPGKAELLQHVVDTGSLRAAAEKMSMSYMKAWRLTRDMNICFREPLIITERGGSLHGGSTVTPAGLKVLKEYSSLTTRVEAAAQASWRKLSRELKAR